MVLHCCCSSPLPLPCLALLQAGAQVVSMSLGSAGYDPSFLQMGIDTKAAGALLVVAAGNGE